MRTFLEKTKVHLAVSLHNPFAAERLEMMPVQNRYPIEEVVKELKMGFFAPATSVSNTSCSGNQRFRPACSSARPTAGGAEMPHQPDPLPRHPRRPDAKPGRDDLVRFRDADPPGDHDDDLRASRGEDIQAACGLLSTRERENEAGSGQRPTGNAK